MSRPVVISPHGYEAAWDTLTAMVNTSMVLEDMGIEPTPDDPGHGGAVLMTFAAALWFAEHQAWPTDDELGQRFYECTYGPKASEN